MRAKIRFLVFLGTYLVLASFFAKYFVGAEQDPALLGKIGGKFTFAVLGDNRTGHDAYKKILGQIAGSKPDFIVNTGDQIEHPGDTTEWARFEAMSKTVTVPYFHTAGNHDVHNRKDELWFGQTAGIGGRPYYSFRTGNSLFVVLDSFLSGQEMKITGEQYQWLESVLADPAPEHRFVFLHSPLYPDPDRGRHYGYCLDRYPKERDRLQALFEKYGVDVVFSGHEHIYLKKNVNGVLHIVTGGAGAPLYAGPGDGGFYHFLMVHVDGKGFSGEVIDINGMVRDRF